MTASVPSVSALTAITAAPAGRAQVQPGFEAALSHAQQATSEPVVGPDSMHEESPEQQGASTRRNQGETPQHPTLRTKPAGHQRTGASLGRRQPTTAHPLVENDVAAATAVTPAPAAVTPADSEKPPVGVGAASATTASGAPAGDPETAATQPGDETPPAAGQPVGDLKGALPETAPVTSPPAPPADQPSPVAPVDRETANLTAPTTTGAAPQPGAATGAQPEAPSQPTTLPVPDGAPVAQQPTSPAAPENSPSTTAAQVTVTAPGQHRHGDPEAPAPAAPQAGSSTATVTATADRGESPGNGAGDNPGDTAKQAAPVTHGRPSAGTETQSGPATPYSTVADRSAATAAVAAATAAPDPAEMPATQALPAGTLDQIHAAEHSVRVQVETDGFGKVTADLHSRPGELGVHLNVPDDTGRALMAQRMDALRTSLGQSGTAVHLSLAAQDQSSQSFPGQQGSTPREDRAPAPSAPQPHDAATPRATDGSPVTAAPADRNRLVDVRA